MKTVKTLAADKSIQINFPGGFILRQKPIAEIDLSSEPALLFNVALNAVSEMMEASAAIANDPDLSAGGKSRKRDPMVIAAVHQIARCYTMIGNYSNHLDTRYAAMVSVPQLQPNDAVGALQDMECRQYWASLGIAAQSRLVEQMDAGPELARLEAALLRSPLAVADELLSVLRSNHDRGQRALNPSESVAISAGKATVDWSYRGLSQLVAALNGGLEPEWTRGRVLETILNCANPVVQAGYAAWGFTDVQVSEHRRQSEYRATAGLTA